MTLLLALRALVTRPVRTAVLACGFGFGISVMAALLGVGDVMIEQVSSPALAGGGDVLLLGAGGSLGSARLVLLSLLGAENLERRLTGMSPSRTERLYLVEGKRVTPVTARGGIPSLERAVGDPETSALRDWMDAPGDRAWTSPDPGAVLRAIDRFHPIPDVPARAASWAEWLYFNGQARGTRFYLTFLVGPRGGSGRRAALVRAQIDRDGRLTNYSEKAEVAESDLRERAPDLDVGGCRVRLDGTRYRIALLLRPESSGGAPLVGTITLDGHPERSVPPFAIHGASGWLSGYVVPVLSGPLGGELRVGRQVLPLDGGTGYHDHNWGFWGGVSWQWGQVSDGGLSILYGRVHPPPDAADPDRIPGFLAVLGRDGPLGFSTDVTIAESGEREEGAPRRIEIRASGGRIDLRMDATVESAVRTRIGRRPFGSGEGAKDFLQLRARFRVAGRVGDREIAFSSPGTAETFRER